jgi:hypothetical protein
MIKAEGGRREAEENRSPVTGHHRSRLIVVAALGALMLAGCDYFLYTSIKDIQATPLKFEGQEVRLKGTVTNVTELPLLNTKAYTLQDGDAKIVVIISQGQLPAMSDKVKLKGTIRSTMIVNGKAVGQRVEETQRFK